MEASPEHSHVVDFCNHYHSLIPRNTFNARQMSASEEDRLTMSELEISLIEQPSDSHSSPPPTAPFDKLATEIIQEIFNLACPNVTLNLKGTSVPFHFRLGLVCQKWGSIVAAHHSLWADFEINPRGESNPTFGARLRNYLQKSGTHPLRIQIWKDGSDEVLSDIVDAIIPHCERWGEIKFYFPLEYHLLEKLRVVQDRLPLLQCLHIMGPLKPYPAEIQPLSAFRDALSLNHISISRINMDAARVLGLLPWSHVSHATLDYFSFKEIQSSLELSQTLTTLTLSKERLHASSYSPLPLKSPATLKELQVLRVHCNVDIGFLTRPSFKRLEAFSLDGRTILKFLNNSSCTLAHLELRGVKKSTIDPILQHTSLAGLTFLHLEDDWSKSLDNILVLDSRRLLPALEILHVSVDFNSSWSSGNRDFNSRIGDLESVVLSRTYDRHGEAGILSELNAITDKRAIMSLKECQFDFTRDRGRWEAWQDRTLQCLRSFCDSRDVLVILRQFNHKDVQPCDDTQCDHIVNSYESDDSDPELEAIYYQTFGRY